MELEILLFNPYHDKLGRFASAKGRVKAKWDGLSEDKKRKVKVAAALGGAAVVAAGVGYVAYRYHEGSGEADLGGIGDVGGLGVAGIDRQSIESQLTGGGWKRVDTPVGGAQKPSVVSNGEELAIEKSDAVMHEGALWGTARRMFGDGMGMAGREEAYSVIAKELGYEKFVPPTVALTDKKGVPFSRQWFVKGTPPGPKGVRKGHRQGFIMDSLTLHGDRHGGNKLWDVASGHEIKIDNSFSFPSSVESGMRSNQYRKLGNRQRETVFRTSLSPSEMGRMRKLWGEGTNSSEAK